jgi:ATP-dependent protease Clp ATPase subunit
MYDIPARDDIEKVIISKSAVESNSCILMIPKTKAASQ